MNQATLLDFDKYFLIYKYIAHVCMYVCMKHAFRLLVKTNLGANLETTVYHEILKHLQLGRAT